MTPAIDNILGRHEERLNAHDREFESVQKQQTEDRIEVRGLKNWIMGTLAAACGGMVLQIIMLLARKG